MMGLLYEWNDPTLWQRVSKHLKADSQLDLSGAMTSATLPHLVHLLQAGQANDVTLLK